MSENKIIEIKNDDDLKKYERRPVSIKRHITVGQLEKRVDMLTAMLLLHGAPQQVLDQVQSLHEITKELREQLREEERGRALAAQLNAALREKTP